MPDLVHPLLREREDAKPHGEPPGEPEPQPVETPEATAPAEEPSAPPSEPAEGTQPVAPEPQPSEEGERDDQEEYFRIPKEGTYRSLKQLQQDDPRFGHALKTLVGRAAKAEYEPQIRDRDRRIAELEQQLHEREVGSLTEEEVRQKYYEDPEFRRRHDARQHSEPEVARAQESWQAAIDAEFERLEDVVPPEGIDQFRRLLSTGYYDALWRRDAQGRILRDATGRPVAERQLSGPEGFRLLVQDMRQAEMHYQQQAAAGNGRRAAPPPPPPPAPAASAAPPPPAEPPKPAPQPNPRLGQSRPDLSPSGGGGSRGPIRLSEVRQMSREERMARWPNDGDYDRDFRAGLIVRDA